MAAIAVFLTYRAVIAISKDHGNFLTTFEWNTGPIPPVFGIAVLAFGTVVSSIIAMVIAVPIAVGIALFISHYAPRRLGGPVAYVIDLLAAVPSHRLRPVGRALPGAAHGRPVPLAGQLLRLDRHLPQWTRAAPPARCSPWASCWRS